MQLDGKKQTTHYDGQLSMKDSSGNWQVTSVCHGSGFKEYTAERK
jgi:hypothetical protein